VTIFPATGTEMKPAPTTTYPGRSSNTVDAGLCISCESRCTDKALADYRL